MYGCSAARCWLQEFDVCAWLNLSCVTPRTKSIVTQENITFLLQTRQLDLPLFFTIFLHIVAHARQTLPHSCGIRL